MNKVTLIVAAGSGSRMNAGIPKQFLVMNDMPVLMHTIQRFFDYNPKSKIILVLPENEIQTWQNLVGQYSFKIPHGIVKGGATRFLSVKKGLDEIKEHCIVAIHDGVRPLCSSSLIKRCFDEAEKNSNAIPAIPITETIREIKQQNNSIIDRENLRIIQTPQCFDSILIRKAYQNNETGNFTDDSSVFEHDGNKIHLIEGERNNIKITVPDDLVIAAAIEREMFRR